MSDSLADNINFNSPEHISAMLYGGTIKVKTREAYEFKYKDGRTKIKEHWVDKPYVLPRLIAPLEGTKGAKEGVWSVAEDILVSLRPKETTKRIIEVIIELSL